MAFKLLGYASTLFIMGTEEAFHMLAVSGASFTNIYSYIQHSPLYATDQLALGEWRALEVQATHYSVRGHTLVVLDEVDRVTKDWCYLLVKFSL